MNSVQRVLVVIWFCIMAFPVFAQIQGVVTDEQTGEPIPYLNVYYEGKGVGTITDEDGRYTVAAHVGWNKLTFSMVGYSTRVMTVSSNTRTLNVKMRADLVLDEVIVKPKKQKYSRKNNPAVEMMKKVIASKKKTDMSEKDYYSFNKYQKLTFALNNITADSLKESKLFKKYPFFKDQVEFCEETQKNILPLSVDETVTQKVYRKDPRSEKDIIKGLNSSGVNQLFNTGDMLTTVLKDVFQDVNIYDDKIRLFQNPFDSPISQGGLGFYRYFIMDTLMVERDKCFHLTFVPNNSQDFGFTGHLYIMADSTFRVKKCILNLPKKTDVNFVNSVNILQEFEALPTGEWVLKTDDMSCDMTLYKFLGNYWVKRTTKYSDFTFEEIPNKIFKRKGTEIKESDAMMRDDQFWNAYRQVPLSESEGQMDQFVNKLTQIKGFKYIIFILKAEIENFVETGTKKTPSKVDIGPINTMISSNYIDGTRLRLSAQTTANLNKHWFFKGYGAYGFKDEKWKYLGQVQYSFNKKEYLPREYPMNCLTLSYQYDDMTPSDKFMPTDKDNVFTSFKVCDVDQYNYERTWNLKYEWEQESGLRTTLGFKVSNLEPCGKLFYRTLDGENQFQNYLSSVSQQGETERAKAYDMQNLMFSPYNVHDINVTEAMVGIRFAPGETFINTKQRRVPINLDAPVFTANHTFGIKAFGADYSYNYTELGIYKRLWLGSWGNIDTYLKGGIQWNKVPFPLLIMPAANLSYIAEEGTFNLINNMEFLNDRFASLDVSWNLQGKILNRIPLLKKLKWREYIGIKCLWGDLTDKNNPFLQSNSGDNTLMMFPGHYQKVEDASIYAGKAGYGMVAGNNQLVYQYTSNVMDKKTPYVEAAVGIHNIFKLLHVEYVWRLNYRDLPTANKSGIRLQIRTVF